VKIAYVLADPERNGGNKVAFQHAELLRGLGHAVSVAGEGERPAWAAFGGPYVDLSAGGTLPSQDLLLATFWTTIRRAQALDAGPVAHFCQGYEGALEHLRPALAEIEAAYREALPALIVAPHLAAFLGERFGRACALAPPPLDPLFRPVQPIRRFRPSRSPWIAVPGIFEAPVKGVRTALEAIARLRARGLKSRLLRFSFLPASEEEAGLLASDRYLCGVPPEEVARQLAACDLLLFPSLEGEGFGLPLLEAMASGVPAVASAIPSARFIGGGAVPLVPPGDVEAMTAAAESLLGDPRAWRRARREGLLAAERFRPQNVAALLDGAVSWAARKAAESGRR